MSAEYYVRRPGFPEACQTENVGLICEALLSAACLLPPMARQEVLEVLWQQRRGSLVVRLPVVLEVHVFDSSVSHDARGGLRFLLI